MREINITSIKNMKNMKYGLKLIPNPHTGQQRPPLAETGTAGLLCTVIA